jgi:hypothetical protein
MAKLGAVLERQLKKLGIDITDELKPLIAADLEVPEEIAKKIDQGLLTIEAAKTNPEITKVLKQSTLAGADAKMDDIIKEMGLTVGDDFVNEKNTYEKIAMLSKMLHQHGLKKGEGNSKGDLSQTLQKEREAWGKKEEEMQKKLQTLTESLTTKETEYSNTRSEDRKEMAFFKKLLPKDYVFPKDMDNEIKVTTAMGVINTKLKSLGLHAKLNEAGTLIITDKDGNKAYNERHEPIDDVDSFIDGVLTQNKLLNVNDPTKQQQQQTPGSLGAGGIQLTGANKNAHILNEIDAQLKSMA